MPTTIHAAAHQLRTGERTPVDLVEDCLTKIDHYEDKVQAWVFVAKDSAMAQAEALGKELKRGRSRGPLHGIPLGIKDIYDVFDWPTAAGSKLWADSIARADSTVVKKLRQAGAVFLGKTVTTQYASFDPPKTVNPWNHGRTPGGSSSGSAAAVACGMCPGAMGSQTGGSITRPASFCGAAGLKPTYGRVALGGVMPLAPSMDHPGPFATCVRDLAIMLQAIAGPDAMDRTARNEFVPDYVAVMDEYAARPPTIAWLRGMFEEMAEPPMADLMHKALTTLQEKGAEIFPTALPSSFAEVLPRHHIIMAVEAAAFHKERLQDHPEDYEPNIRSLIESGLNCPATEYALTREHQRQLKREMRACFDAVDVLLAPAVRGPAPDKSTTGDLAFNAPWSYTGLPVVSINAGWSDDGMPMSIQLIGRPWDEAKLLAAAAWCEQALKVEEREPA